MKCESCKWAEKHPAGGAEVSKCRLNPPKNIRGNAHIWHAWAFPLVRHDPVEGCPEDFRYSNQGIEAWHMVVRFPAVPGLV